MLRYTIRSMEKYHKLITKTYHSVRSDSLKRSSLLLILAQLTNAGGLFFFWIINARLFSASLVGLATAFISFGVLVATFTNLGLPNTIIRFLPKSKLPGGLFSSSLALVSLSSMLGGLIALELVSRIAPRLDFINNSTSLEILFVMLVMSTAVSALLDGTLVSFRKGELVLTKSVIVNIPRLVIPFFAVAAGVRGMTSIYTLTLLLGIGYNLVMIVGKLLAEHSLRPDLGLVLQHKAYATSNYFGGLFGVLPITLVPIIVLNQLGAASAAYFYIPMMIAAMISLICNSISQALISECAQTDDLDEQKHFFKRAMKHQYQLLLPLIGVLIVFAWPVLDVYGRAYADNGFLPLVVLILSGLFVGLNWLGDTWLNITKRHKDYFLMNAFNAVSVVGFVYLFSKHGLVAVAFGWMLGQITSAIVYLSIFARSQLMTLFKLKF